jgi:hypothetical protein
MWWNWKTTSHRTGKCLAKGMFTMAKQGAKIWIVVVSLCMLAMGAACRDPIVGADGGEQLNIIVDDVELSTMESFPVQVAALVRGNLPDGCSVLDGISATRAGNVFTLNVTAHRKDGMCTAALVPFEERVALDVEGLKAGTYRVVAGDVSAEFTFDVDNGQTGGNSAAYVRGLRGTVTAIETGVDGIQVTLADGDKTYSVTISVIQAHVFGRWDQIREQAEIVVSGPIIAGMEPAWVVAERVTVLGSDPDYVLNLKGTVTAVEPGTDGITVEIEASDGTLYTATISLVTTEIVYIGTDKKIQVGTPIWVSGELFALNGAHIAADTAVVNPVPTTVTVEVRPIPR